MYGVTIVSTHCTCISLVDTTVVLYGLVLDTTSGSMDVHDIVLLLCTAGMQTGSVVY